MTPEQYQQQQAAKAWEQQLQAALETSSEVDSQPENLLSDEMQAMRQVCQDGFLEYCLAIDHEDRGDVKKYERSKFHILLTRTLQSVYERVMRGEDVRMIISTPPRHGKTRTTSILFPSWVLGKTALPFIVSSYSQDLADKLGQDTRDVMTSEAYRAIFDARIRSDMAAKANWGTVQGGRYLATGVGVGITGKGFKIGIIDDPFKDDAEANSETERENKWNWYKSTFYTRQEGNTAIIVIATRWHLDDLSGKLLEQEEKNRQLGLPDGSYDQWEVVNFPAIAEEDEYVDGELWRAKGLPLWPEKFPIQKLTAIRNSMNDLYRWSALYQQSPILTDNAEFRKEWFKFYEPADIKDKNLAYYTLVDLAISQKQRADNTVVLTIGKDRNGPNWYIIEETSGKLDPLQTIDAIFMHYEKYRSSVWIESVAYQAALQYFVLEEQRRRQMYFNVNELTHSKAINKETRIRGLIPLGRAGILHFLREHTEMIREFLQFPKGRHDDRIDAVSMGIQAIQNTAFEVQPDKDKELEADFDPHAAFGRM